VSPRRRKRKDKVRRIRRRNSTKKGRPKKLSSKNPMLVMVDILRNIHGLKLLRKWHATSNYLPRLPLKISLLR
jgi:hypothetical protein